MSPASGNAKTGIQRNAIAVDKSFHSINVPSEWEQSLVDISPAAFKGPVSIQLMSPASGNRDTARGHVNCFTFPFN